LKFKKFPYHKIIGNAGSMFMPRFRYRYRRLSILIKFYTIDN